MNFFHHARQLELPVCAEDELLEFNGTDLLCKKIRKFTS